MSSIHDINMKNSAIKAKQTKAAIVEELAVALDCDKKLVRTFLAAQKQLVERHMKKGGSGEFTIPDLGIKVKRVKKKATKERQGRNPFTGEEITIAAKKASTSVRATALKALKDLAG